MERNHLDIRPRNAITKIRVVFNARDRMPILGRRQVVDQIDQSVFHPAHVEMMDDVQDERRLVRRHGSRRMKQHLCIVGKYKCVHGRIDARN